MPWCSRHGAGCCATGANSAKTAFPLSALARTPFQQLWIEWVDIQDLCYHMADAPDLVVECMELMGGVVRRICEVAAGLGWTSSTSRITSPHPSSDETNFRRWCVPYL